MWMILNSWQHYDDALQHFHSFIKTDSKKSKQHNKIPIQNIPQNFWNKCSQMRNNCKCLSSAQCSLITIINAKAPLILRVQVFWDVMLCHWPSGFSHFEGSCCLQTKQKWTATFGHRWVQKSIWLPQNDEKTQYHCTLSTLIKSSMMPVLSGSSCIPVCHRQTLCPSPGFWHNSVPSCFTWQTCIRMSPKISVPGHNPNWMTTKLCVFTWDLDFGMKSSKSHQIHFQVILLSLDFSSFMWCSFLNCVNQPKETLNQISKPDLCQVPRVQSPRTFKIQVLLAEFVFFN
jgi:hypothetical protein